MKTKLMILLLVLTAISLSVNTFAQVATKQEKKEIGKHEKELNKKIQANAPAEARKEAKKLQKEGFQVPAGKLPIEKQLEKAWQAQYEVDRNGFPYYMVATQRAIGGNYSSAALQANNLAKLDLAGQLQTKVSQLIEARIANNELGQEEAASLNSVVGTSKSVISGTLGRVITYVEISRTLPNKNVEVQITLGYNSDLATREAIQAIKRSLSEDQKNLSIGLDKLNVPAEK